MGSKASSKKMLLAVRPKDLPIVSAALGSEFDLIICHTVEEAQAYFAEHIGLIACGVRFSNDRLFDLLRAVKAHPNTRRVPFYLMLGEGSKYSEAILDGIRIAAEVLGSSGLVDLSRLESDLGKAEAYRTLRETVREHLKE
jgi:hypothetical protein